MSILQENIKNFLETFLQYEDGYLGEMQKKAEDEQVPIISKDTAQFLKTIASMKNPKNILEIGCAVGFSSSLFGKYSNKDCKITTIELNHQMYLKATENIKNQNLEHRIKIIEGDGLQVIKELKNLKEKYDLIFLDAAKGQYVNILDDLLCLLDNGGLLIADNVLQKGTIAEPTEDIKKRKRTIHKRMNEFLIRATNLEDYLTTIVPIGDGVLLCQKRCIN